ncbi:MAG: hypothetical protein GEU80_09085 [Dehalococcoidia bacterium]|nr:hypothetical protein [Dehalococcoidia bacterium]
MAWRFALLVVLAAVPLVACDNDVPSADEPIEARPGVEGPRASPTGVATEDLVGAYLALGDSVAVGVGARARPAGYPSVVHQRLAEQGRVTDLVNLAVSGETAISMRVGGQLAAATRQLEERNGNDTPEDDVALVTLTIGGNEAADLYRPCAAGPTERCLRSAAQVVEAFRDRFQGIVHELAEAAGDDATIVTTTYYNPLRHPECALRSQVDLADEFLEGGPSMPDEIGFNDVIREVAGEEGMVVADLFGRLGASQLTSDCLHPNAEGHAIIAGSILEALEEAAEDS